MSGFSFAAERPIEKYVRFKNNIQEWYNECKKWGLNEEDINNRSRLLCRRGRT